jgi:hypothetical protein
MKNMSLRSCNYIILQIGVLCLLISTAALAGPPFKTDDPQPVDYLHWEFYVASMQQIDNNQTSATLPHFEVNYGVVPNVQLHLVAPLGYVHEADATHYGYSDMELGIKYRFVEETETTPQVGIFPLVELPSGDENKQLGVGKIQVYIPLWIQKSWGNWTTYGGEGFWYNPVPNQKNWIFTGWELQYDFSKVVTLGGELCYQTANAQDSEAGESFNLGGFINFDEANHLLFSLGHSLSGKATITGYIGYQLTI